MRKHPKESQHSGFYFSPLDPVYLPHSMPGGRNTGVVLVTVIAIGVLLYTLLG